MSKLRVPTGTTSHICHVRILDSSATDGSGLTGVLYNSAGISAYYVRPGDATATAITLADITTLGTYVSGGFKEYDATNMPGIYEIHIPNTAFASGADQVVVMMKGVTNMADLSLEIELYDDPVIRKNVALSNIEFLMVDSSDKTTPKTGLTVTGQRSLDGGAFGAVSGAIAEVGNGIYQFDAAAADMNGNIITFKFTATGAETAFISIRAIG